MRGKSAQWAKIDSLAHARCFTTAAVLWSRKKKLPSGAMKTGEMHQLGEKAFQVQYGR